MINHSDANREHSAKKNQTFCSSFSFLSLSRLLAWWTIMNDNVISSLNSVLSHRCPAHVPSLVSSRVPVYATIVSENGTIERITTSFLNKRCYAGSFPCQNILKDSLRLFWLKIAAVSKKKKETPELRRNNFVIMHS